MSFSAARRALAIAMAGPALAAPAQAAAPAATAFDARPGHAAAAPGQATQALRKALGAQGLVSSDPRTGTVRAAGRLDGALTGPSGKDGAAVALDYVRAHGSALGLPSGSIPGLAPEHRTVTPGGLEVLTWRQRRAGIPSADSYLRAAVDAEGRLLSLSGAPAADLSPPTLRPAITAARALAAVTGAVAPQARRRGNDPEQHTTFTGGATASLVLYQGGDGARLGWRVVAPIGPGELADAIVDAADATVVKRANRVKAAAPGDALVFPSLAGRRAAGDAEPEPVGHGGDTPSRRPGPRLPRPGRRRRQRLAARGPRGRRRLGRPAGRAAGLRRRHRALHMDPAEPARQQGAQRDAALLLRQHVPRPPRRRADRLQRRDRRLRPGRPDLRPVVGLRREGRCRHPQQRELRRLPGRRPRPARRPPLRRARQPARRRQRSLAGVPRGRARDERAPGHRRPGLERAERDAGLRHRRGHERLLRARLPRRERLRGPAGQVRRSTSGPGCATRRSTATRSSTAR